MNSPVAQSTAPRRRIWPWVLGICVAPFVVLGTVAFSYLTLDHDARLLRREVMAATAGPWHTKVQLSVGRLTIDALHTVLLFVHGKDGADARRALRAVDGASVGVYDLEARETDWSRDQLLTGADEAMRGRGWTRLVSVLEAGKSVLVYTTDNPGDGDSMHLCLAVVDGRKLVVVSTTVNAAGLADLVEKHTGHDLRHALHFAMP